MVIEVIAGFLNERGFDIELYEADAGGQWVMLFFSGGGVVVRVRGSNIIITLNYSNGRRSALVDTGKFVIDLGGPGSLGELVECLDGIGCRRKVKMSVSDSVFEFLESEGFDVELSSVGWCLLELCGSGNTVYVVLVDGDVKVRLLGAGDIRTLFEVALCEPGALGELVRYVGVIGCKRV